MNHTRWMLTGELGGKVVELYIWVLVLFNISAVLGEEGLEFFNVFSIFFLFRSSSFVMCLNSSVIIQCKDQSVIANT